MLITSLIPGFFPSPRNTFCFEASVIVCFYLFFWVFLSFLFLLILLLRWSLIFQVYILFIITRPGGMFNISAFDAVDCGDKSDQFVDSADDSWKIGVAAGAPLFVLLIVMLVLVRQNLEAMTQLVDSFDRLLNRLRSCLASAHDEEVDIELGLPQQLPSAGVPRNLCDDEILRRETRAAQVWI